MGVNGVHNTVGKNIGAYNTVCVRVVAEYRFLQVYMVWSLVLRFDLCALPYFLRTFPGLYRAGVPGRLVPVGSDCASWRRAVSRVVAHSWSETRVGVRSSALARPSGRRGHPEAGWRLKRALRSERWAGVGKRAMFLLGQTFRSVIGLPFWPIVPILGLAHELRCLLVPSLCWEAGLRGIPGL